MCIIFLRLSAIFQNNPDKSVSYLFQFWNILELRTMEVVVTTGLLELVVQSSSQIITTNKPTHDFSQAGCPSCRPVNTVGALKGERVTFYGLANPKLSFEPCL